MPEKGKRGEEEQRSRGARAMSWIEYHLTGPAGSLPTLQHHKTPQYGGQLLLPVWPWHGSIRDATLLLAFPFTFFLSFFHGPPHFLTPLPHAKKKNKKKHSRHLCRVTTTSIHAQHKLYTQAHTHIWGIIFGSSNFGLVCLWPLRSDAFTLITIFYFQFVCFIWATRNVSRDKKAFRKILHALHTVIVAKNKNKIMQWNLLHLVSQRKAWGLDDREVMVGEWAWWSGTQCPPQWREVTPKFNASCNRTKPSKGLFQLVGRLRQTKHVLYSS